MGALGDFIRAARLGFRWSEQLGAFLRFGVLGEERWLVEIAPRGLLPGNVKTERHVVWWETQEGEPEDHIVTLSPALLSLGSITSYRALTLDADGREVTRPDPRRRSR
ncbi:MAG TPA: hypothetical protein VFP50_15190 [Anaeromyxobacteraceae bacterium]|nr:hypothetical protein [Anaeromyxobacteraceae bacterium]